MFPIAFVISLFAPLSFAETPKTAGTTLELVESWPSGTTLDHADIRDANVVWKEMIDGAHTSLDFGEFYATDHPGSRLEPVISAIEAATARGVKVRFLLETKFKTTSAETAARLAAIKGVTVRYLDWKQKTGGILHAKYFVVDATSAYVGSQNFDWRSLEHIQELGVRITAPEAARALEVVFDGDWAFAGGEAIAKTAAPAAASLPIGDGGTFTLVASPKDILPDGLPWELPRIVALIDGAHESVRVQVLTYKMIGRDDYFADLENALRRAAARKVKVQLLVSDWCMRKGTIEGLKSLEPIPNIEVKLVTIPQDPSGFIPYARVVHAKYMIVDGKSAWVGTSNWERDYFTASRNASVIIEGGLIPKRLDAFFLDGWNSTYAKAVDPSGTYTPPKIGDN